MKQPLQDFFVLYSAAMRRSSNATIKAYIADFGGLLQIVGGSLFSVKMYPSSENAL